MVSKLELGSDCMNKFMILIVMLVMMLYWVDSLAVEFTVTTTDDTTDASLADGLCLDINGECSLRAAIMQTNILGTDDVIYLARGAAYELTLNDGIDTQGVNDLDIFDTLTLSIVNPEIPIESLSDMPGVFAGSLVNDRVFEIHDGEQVSFNGVFIFYGDATNSLSNKDLGGGIYVSDQVTEFRMTDSIIFANEARFGGGLYSNAEITWIESTDISYNFLTETGLPLLGIAGAGIFHGGSVLTLNKSSVHHNVGLALGFFASTLQFEGEDSEVRLLNTLVAENGIRPTGGSGRMNGITANQANLYINNSNITGNTWFGIRFDSTNNHVLTIRNSVLSANEFDNCAVFTGQLDFGESLSPAHIVSSDLSCSLPDLANNVENVDAGLSPVEGRFESLDFQFFSSQFPMIGSVLIDAGSSLDVNSGHISACEATDIRGVDRPLSGGGLLDFCDVGIYESNDLIFSDGYEFID